eukprot:673107-Pelagomonas_calceolata.AAC.2
MGLDLDGCLEKIRKCEILAEEELKALCEYVRALELKLLHTCGRFPWTSPDCMPLRCAPATAGERDTGRGEQCAARERTSHGECKGERGRNEMAQEDLIERALPRACSGKQLCSLGTMAPSI